MLKHNILLFFRNIKRHKSTFLINIFGLSTGLACVLLIALWVNDELNVDKFHNEDGQRYQIMQSTVNEKGMETTGNTPAPLAETLKNELPEIAYSVSVIPTSFNSSNGIVSSGDIHYKSTAHYATRDFFKVFPYHLLKGDENDLLLDKNGTIISSELARKLFGTVTNALGKPIIWNVQDIKVEGYVSGIFDNIPKSIKDRFDLVLPMDAFLEYRPWFKDWQLSAQHTFVLLKKQANVAEINLKIKDYLKTKGKSSPDLGTLFLQKYSDIYLYGRYENGEPIGGRIDYVRLFSIIALFILVIACVNFMNLSTAKATKRMNEVGIKKVVGASRKTLIFQYLTESALMVLLSLGVALALSYLLMPLFNEITGKTMGFDFPPHFIWAIVGIALFTALLAGSYPALYLSAQSPVLVLKGKLTDKATDIWARKGLIVFQFIISIILIVAVSVVYQQIRYVQSKNLGYDKDQIVYFRVDQPTDELISTIKNIPGVINAAGAYNNMPISKEFGTTKEIDWEGKDPGNKTSFTCLNVGYGFIETLGMTIREGRSFSKGFGSKNQVLLNETAIQSMGITDPIGKMIDWGAKMEIVGIVRDFNFESLHEKVKPCIIQLYPATNLPKILVKIKAGSEKTTLAKLEQFYKNRNQGLTFDYAFMDDDFRVLYSSERRVAMLSKYFAGLAILISCLGLLGLTAFTAERRKKEIGIRKVLGQSAAQVMIMLSGEFAKMVLIAIIIALPIAYMAGNNWLSGFAYRIPLKVWYFLGAGLLALLVALLTVGSQAIRAANKNPVNALKEE